MAVPKRVLELIDLFDRNRDAYRSGKYKETQLRHEFVDPFFMALGWDVNNESGYAEAYKDVIHEDAIKVGGATKAPDYCFRIGGTRKFFLEAKKPSVDIKGDIHPAYQLRRYAWTAKLPLSILTDFEEFAVYDCRVRPVKTDNASAARKQYITYTDYAEKWDEIASVFSRDAVLKGSFDKYAGGGRPRGAQVDTAFLKDIESWRETLARNIALRNPKLTQRELNFAVQRTIDRIIFLRICEDRGVEIYGRLMALLNGDSIYKRLCRLFSQADDRYNSGLFHFRKEKDRLEPPDELTLRLAIDDKLLKDMIRHLYYPDSPYEFSVFPADILGQVYEQFLGKVIRLTPGHRAKVEDKPEVKKAGGVYYTPTYIVDYIVKNTVGKLLGTDSTGGDGSRTRPKTGKGRKKAAALSPKEVSEIRILDPACGSGSFLLGAYQYLLDWHRDWYTHDGPEKWAKKRPPRVYQGPGGDWRLTTAERKRILLNNIYGVDIDVQAVEVTKLSLLLKVLEGESSETIGRTLELFHERALPDLGNNIKCGNSLIGPDFYDNKQMDLFDEGERYRINAFDWEAEFPDIMKAGGFDVVIGNPPYVFGGTYGISQQDKTYFRDTYHSGTGKVNLFTLFTEKALRLLRMSGLMSFIIPNTFLRVTSYKPTREFVLTRSAVKQVVDLGTGVFSGATTSSIIFVLERTTDPQGNVMQIRDGVDGEGRGVKQSHFFQPGFVFNIYASHRELGLISEMRARCLDLGTICKELIFGVVIAGNFNEVVHDTTAAGRKPFLEGRDIGRYFIRPVTKYLDYDKEKLHRARTPHVFEAPEKLLIQRITGGLRPVNAAYDNQQLYNKESINNLILNDNTPYSVKYVLGLLNSQLVNWFYRVQFTNQSTLTVNLSKEYMSQIPIRQMDFADAQEVELHGRTIQLVDRMLSLHKQLAAAKTAHDKTVLQRQIDATDRQIDQLVYELYDLTDEEIAIVEGATRQ